MHLRINPSLEIQLVRLADGVTCAVVDDFLLNPGEAVDFAAAQAERFEEQERAYPGRVLPVAGASLDEPNRFLQRELSRLFAFCRGELGLQVRFSLITLQPEACSWIHRLPHTTPPLAEDRVTYTAVLYLFDNPELGGTGFYRWKDPEFPAQMTALQCDDPDAGLERLRERYPMFREPARYVTESNELCELLDHAPARFNRLVFYSGEVPHSAWITRPDLLTGDPRTGRLTLNWFLSAVPKS